MDEAALKNEIDPNPSCIEQRRKTVLVNEEFAHTRKRLARAKVVPLVQFCVFAYNCANHEVPDAAHVDFASQGSSLAVPDGLQRSIFAVEQLLAALKAKLQ